jgi:hypothetical protein
MFRAILCSYSGGPNCVLHHLVCHSLWAAVQCTGWERTQCSTCFVIPDGCIIFMQFYFGVLLSIYSFFLFCNAKFEVFLTLHHSINLFLLPTWCTIHVFYNICITLNTSTCFEQYYAHLQEEKLYFYSIWYRHSAVQCTGWERSQSVHYTAARREWHTRCCRIQFEPPEDEHTIARNMSR